jgi:hypothetical protein
MKPKADNLFERAFQATLQRTHDSTHARLSTQRRIVAVLRLIWFRGGNTTTRTKTNRLIPIRG